MSRSLLAMLAVAACWTGAEPRVEAPATSAATPARGPGTPRLRVRLERTPCLGQCPTYTVTIHEGGRVEWEGRENVIAAGPRQGRVTAAELEQLNEMIEAADFFERDPFGEHTDPMPCQKNGNTTTCSFSSTICSDTSHTIITVMRGTGQKRVDMAHCEPNPGLDELEAYIESIAHTQAWVGP